MKFYIQSGYKDRSVLGLMSKNYNIKFSAQGPIEPDRVPLGSVEWTEGLLGRYVCPDFFPEFLSQHIKREWHYTDIWPETRMFIKSSEQHKHWDSGFSDEITRRKGNFLVSEPVEWINEYRYYVADGRVLGAWWYWGRTSDKNQIHVGSDPPDAPELDVEWPEYYCGAVDFGELPDGTMSLVEANAPYACGWYGDQKDIEIFANFAEAGWRYINSR